MAGLMKRAQLNRQLKPKICRWCDEEFQPHNSMQYVCSPRHASLYATAKREQRERIVREKMAKLDRAAQRARKRAIKTRTQWYDELQMWVNRYVLRVRDKGKPCCTCNTTNDIKYDAGHYRSRGSCPELRFELTNIHAQCSMKCNQHGSGMRAEYRDFITAKYGADHLVWLDGPHPTLKEQFPHVDDIEAEIKRYKLLCKGV